MLPAMRHATLEVIRDEHQALAAMLRSMRLLVEQAHREGHAPDFLHHRKESELLFPKVRERCPGLGPVIDRLDREHAAGELMVRELAHTLLAYEVLGESRREACEQAVRRYVTRYLDHMGVEEEQILPAARKHLTAADWTELDAAFSANRDPLTGFEPGDEYRPLFDKILATTPAPVGLGPARFSAVRPWRRRARCPTAANCSTTRIAVPATPSRCTGATSAPRPTGPA